jgi:hypothetical protein
MMFLAENFLIEILLRKQRQMWQEEQEQAGLRTNALAKNGLVTQKHNNSHGC